MRDTLLDSGLVYGDETIFQVLKEPGRRPLAKSYVWAQASGTGPPVRLFAYTPGRGAQHARPLYAGIRSGTVLMSDGYDVYNGLAREHELVHLGCWAHARHLLIRAEESVPKAARTPELLATRFIGLTGRLFAAEARSANWEYARRQRQPAAQGAAISVWAMAEARTLLAQRQLAYQQQPVRERDPAIRGGLQGLAVR